MSDHDAIRALLATPGELSPEERKQVDRHLGVCEECRAAAEAYREQDALFQPFPRVSPPPRVREAVLRYVDTRPHASRPLHRLPLRYAGLLTAALVVALVPATSTGLLRSSGGDLVSPECAGGGDGWVLRGTCQVVGSPRSFRGKGVIVYGGSWRWVQAHMTHPTYVVQRGPAIPIAFVSGAHDVAVSKVAASPRNHVALYAVGTVKP